MSSPRGPTSGRPPRRPSDATRRAAASRVPPRRGRRLAAAALVTASLAIAALTPGAGRPAVPARRAAYPTALPAGAGQAIAVRACLICHSATLVTQQAKDSAGWEKSIVQMKTWGAPVTPTEHDTLRGYLLTHFGPRAPAR